ncbi:AraC-like DNA-binding protein [Aequitasia blattaphilus]|uniref:AraC family transcriptional regulator n=1 Tax=Aequitasia blattaphilus TaxID=2949332 RepID=A0ABT1EB50_9FIRM|nr:AraC family transcriptional regulator [Aequitasia blattaphilus]MCP1103063.1 AraC family transcriptional regulator [Aequitasia blattaphilus]MCR8615703.1 AraC family transcriptional regulator [Aequitasia blattaphilus]
MLVKDQKELPKEFPVEIQRYKEKRRKMQVTPISHWHDFMEITYIEKGEATYYVNGNAYFVSSGDMIIFNHMESHYWELEAEELELMILTFSPRIINESMNAMDLEYLIPFLKRGSNFKNKISKEEPFVSEMKVMMEEILEEFILQQPGSSLMIKADILRLLTIMVRHYRQVQGGTKKDAGEDIHRIEQAICYIRNNYENKVTLEEVASLVCMSPNYFSGFFKKTMGQNFQEYVTGLRMEKAKELLKETNYNILDISQRCGVSSIANFYKLYRKIFGIAPGAERQ